MPDEDATRIFSNEKAVSSRPKPGGWNEPAKWKSEGPRDAIGKVEWRERERWLPLRRGSRRACPVAGANAASKKTRSRAWWRRSKIRARASGDSERPLTGQRSESSVLFSLRAMAQSGEEDAARRKQNEAAEERALVARSAAAPLTADVNVLAPPSSAPPPAKRFNSQSELPAATNTAPPARPASGALRPFTAVLGVSLIALGALYATDRWSLVTGIAYTVWQRLGLHR